MVKLGEQLSEKLSQQLSEQLCLHPGLKSHQRHQYGVFVFVIVVVVVFAFALYSIVLHCIQLYYIAF